MFIRKKKNRSGTTSVVVVDKHRGRVKELHTVGVAMCDDEIDDLVSKGRRWIDNYMGVQRIDFDDSQEKG